MKIQRSDLVLYGVAFLAAILAVGMVYGYVENRVAEAESRTEIKTVTVVEKPELRSVVVANREIYRGEPIEVDDIKVLMVPTEGVIANGVITQPDAVVGHVAKQHIFAGEWLIDQKVGLQEETENGVEAFLEKGMRAIRIPVSAESGLLGMLNPSDHVDVISVFESADGKRMISRTILQNIEVLSIGQTNRMGKMKKEQEQESAKNKQGEAFVKASMVALNVNTRQAEQLALAMNVGAIHLALRGPADVALVETDGVNVKVIERSKQRPPKYKPKQNREVIQIMQGDKVQEVITR
ncbi:Flp pilus assembly protein CpaB [Thiomicrorhabdus sp. zzn3]|uniref:Flp pilus assembly protein CpaB n=1 Tax=Thiomicrorhabdus sp. zzn3 TaxID=3039775 RepID=UPI002436FCF8|nr:Flp pilus assembly protein CpaB [Thiomicrorhabdus sp. zzn3]MDG6779047.1 Flp pilus assembly protein CpaB [Thiomicrorhabdus sp. zzn3]